MMTSIHTMPSVSGTNRKWYIAVAANCSRDRSTSCSLTMRLEDDDEDDFTHQFPVCQIHGALRLNPIMTYQVSCQPERR
jgi:hypothetical protein